MATIALADGVGSKRVQDTKSITGRVLQTGGFVINVVTIH